MLRGLQSLGSEPLLEGAVHHPEHAPSAEMFISCTLLLLPTPLLGSIQRQQSAWSSSL